MTDPVPTNISPTAPTLATPHTPSTSDYKDTQKYKDLEMNMSVSKTKKVIMYKNGQCMVIKNITGIVQQDAQFLWSDDLPKDAILGSVWFLPLDNNSKMVSADCQWVKTVEKTEEVIPCTSFLHLLSVNVNHECTITLPPWNPHTRDDIPPPEQRVIQGVIKSVLLLQQKNSNSVNPAPSLQKTTTHKPRDLFSLESKKKPGFLREYRYKDNRQVQVFQSQETSSPASSITYSSFPHADFCVIQTANGDQCIRISEITTLVIKDMNTERIRVRTEVCQTKRLTINFVNHTITTPLREVMMIYFTNGMRWIPTYRLELESETLKSSSPRNPPKPTNDNKVQESSSTTTADSSQNTAWFGWGRSSSTSNSVQQLDQNVSKAHALAVKNLPISKAKIYLQAEVLNALEDLNDVDLDFVVGVANFKFDDTISPMTLSKQVQLNLEELFPTLMGGGTTNQALPQPPKRSLKNKMAPSLNFSNAIMSQVSSMPIQSGSSMNKMKKRSPRSPRSPRKYSQLNSSLSSSSTETGTGPLPSEFDEEALGEFSGTTSSSGDLFVYSMDKATISKGGRALIPLVKSSTSIPFKDVYTWEVHLSTKLGNYSDSVASPQCRIQDIEKWHQVDITNTQNFPWTTGPLFVIQHPQLPISQTLLTYTPPGQKVRLKLTKALNIKAIKTEDVEIRRRSKFTKYNGVYHTKAERRVKLSITNCHSFDINFELTIHVGGKVTASSDATIVTRPFSSTLLEYFPSQVNNVSIVTIHKVIEAGKTYIPEIQFFYLYPSR